MSPPDEISPLKAKSPTFSANYVLYQVVRHLMLDHPEDAEADEHQQIELPLCHHTTAISVAMRAT